MYINTLTDDEDFELEYEEEPVDTLYEMAVEFARWADAKSTPARLRRLCAKISDQADRACLAKGRERAKRVAALATSLAQLEKIVAAKGTSARTQ